MVTSSSVWSVTTRHSGTGSEAMTGDPGPVWGARTWQDDYPIGLEPEELGDLVAPDGNLCLKLPEILDQVARKGVVVAYHQNLHKSRDYSKERTARRDRRSTRIGGRMTLFITETEVENLLDMRSTLDAVEEILRAQAEGRATNRARRRVGLPKSGLNVMFAGAPEIGALGVKAYTVASTGARFYTMLFDPESGELLSVIQSDKLGQLRTGAASGVATKHLAREDADSLGLYGAGWQAESQLEAIAATKKLSRVVVYSRTEESRKAFAEKMGERLGMEIETTHAPEEPAAQDIIVTSTSSKGPVLLGEWLKAGAHINAAGSNFLFKSEIDRDVAKRASLVVVDSREELGLEAGNLLQALETGVVLPEAVRELGQIIAGQVPGRSSPEDVTLFASQGVALEDLAAARLVYDRAVEQGAGREMEF